MDRQRVVVAEIIRPRGNRGEVLVRSQTDVPDRLETLKSAQVRLPNGSDAPVDIEAAWPHKGDWVLKFAGVDSIDTAELFRGGDLWVPVTERGALPEGEFFQSDLVGCRVEGTAGQIVGTLTGWQEFGGPVLMEVEGEDRRTVLIPFSKATCTVRLEERVIVAEVPDGLLDL